MNNASEVIAFVKMSEDDVPRITPIVAEAFSKAVLEALGEEKAKMHDEAFNDNALMQAAFAEEMDAYIIVINGIESGVAFVKVNLAEQAYSLELFCISQQHHSQGVGARVWFELENMYPNAKTWETTTPTFAIKNVNFYVNKCKFHIVELLDAVKIAQDIGDDNLYTSAPDYRYSFRFQKKMN